MNLPKAPDTAAFVQGRVEQVRRAIERGDPINAAVVANCWRKKRFAASVLAVEWARQHQLQLRAYVCTLCEGYHLTSKPQRRAEHPV